MRHSLALRLREKYGLDLGDKKDPSPTCQREVVSFSGKSWLEVLLGLYNFVIQAFLGSHHGLVPQKLTKLVSCLPRWVSFPRGCHG